MDDLKSVDCTVLGSKDVTLKPGTYSIDFAYDPLGWDVLNEGQFTVAIWVNGSSYFTGGGYAGAVLIVKKGVSSLDKGNIGWAITSVHDSSKSIQETFCVTLHGAAN